MSLKLSAAIRREYQGSQWCPIKLPVLKLKHQKCASDFVRGIWENVCPLFQKLSLSEKSHMNKL